MICVNVLFPLKKTELFCLAVIPFRLIFLTVVFLISKFEFPLTVIPVSAPEMVTGLLLPIKTELALSISKPLFPPLIVLSRISPLEPISKRTVSEDELPLS